MNAPSLVLLLTAGVLVASGVYLLLQRTLSRIFIGLGLVTHGVNLLMLSSGGAAGRPSLLGKEYSTGVADPLPQAMILTSIVLSLGTTAFGLALAYRSWRLMGHDEVIDDIEDRYLKRRAKKDADAAEEAATGIEDEGINYDLEEESEQEEDAHDSFAPVSVGEKEDMSRSSDQMNAARASGGGAEGALSQGEREE